MVYHCGHNRVVYRVAKDVVYRVSCVAPCVLTRWLRVLRGPWRLRVLLGLRRWRTLLGLRRWRTDLVHRDRPCHSVQTWRTVPVRACLARSDVVYRDLRARRVSLMA